MAETNSSTTTIIGPDTIIKGEMQFETAAKILGKFEGKLAAKGELHVGQGANCKATVDAGTIIVDGVIEGNVTAREKAMLNATARLTGDITAKTLIVAEGATFTGRCHVGADAVERATAAAATTPGSAHAAAPASTSPSTPAAPGAVPTVETRLGARGTSRLSTLAGVNGEPATT